MTGVVSAATKYTYDKSGRLTKVEYSNGGVVTYTYDKMGNRHEVVTTAGVVAPPPPPPPPANRAPIAVNDYVYLTSTVTTPTSYTVAVKANDSDPDGDPLTVTAVTTPTNLAVATILTNGSISVTNLRNGTTTFTYTLSDGRGLTASALVTIQRDYEPPEPECGGPRQPVCP